MKPRTMHLVTDKYGQKKYTKHSQELLTNADYNAPNKPGGFPGTHSSFQP